MRLFNIKRIINGVDIKVHKISFSPPSLHKLGKNRYNLLLKSDYKKASGSWVEAFLFIIKTLVAQSNYQLVELVGIAPASNDDPQ